MSKIISAGRPFDYARGTPLILSRTPIIKKGVMVCPKSSVLI